MVLQRVSPFWMLWCRGHSIKYKENFLSKGKVCLRVFLFLFFLHLREINFTAAIPFISWSGTFAYSVYLKFSICLWNMLFKSSGLGMGKNVIPFTLPRCYKAKRKIVTRLGSHSCKFLLSKGYFTLQKQRKRKFLQGYVHVITYAYYWFWVWSKLWSVIAIIIWKNLSSGKLRIRQASLVAQW